MEILKGEILKHNDMWSFCLVLEDIVVDHVCLIFMCYLVGIQKANRKYMFMFMCVNILIKYDASLGLSIIVQNLLDLSISQLR
jgi:hypothetical protein